MPARCRRYSINDLQYMGNTLLESLGWASSTGSKYDRRIIAVSYIPPVSLLQQTSQRRMSRNHHPPNAHPLEIALPNRLAMHNLQVTLYEFSSVKIVPIYHRSMIM